MVKILQINQYDTGYPERLAALAQPPKQLRTTNSNVRGLLNQPTLGIVGSRKVSSYGRGITQQLANEMARAGVCIISGLALGVDSIAHRAALEARGKTIAVLPSGIQTIYPAAHRDLARQIVQSDGALISEYKDDFKPLNVSFIQRNRLIAGLSDVLLVTEAAEKSGSLHTANFALELGRPVLAVPGNITSATSRGTNNLIKAGAQSVLSAEDVFEALNLSSKELSSLNEVYGDNEQETTVINLLKTEVSNGDELHLKSHLDIQLFQQTMTMLEIKGIIVPLGNNHWRLK